MEAKSSQEKEQEKQLIFERREARRGVCLASRTCPYECVFRPKAYEAITHYHCALSQVIAHNGLCRENGSRTDTYVPEIYSQQMYRRTYQANFYPILSENFWRDVPFSLTFYPPNIKKEWGRKQASGFRGK
ncbi:hypothetical protein M9H77_10915 [Catharanthus roseus]|uniref:Uncharacterized protein n=1 Tax=Catharanthus roseus TaxID=4058 RepID=A0ACC0BD39_CATRO|nr:hypothetical protein M9H77_10915 [Catharanthus roseus]